jgi:hypothetical protein
MRLMPDPRERALEPTTKSVSRNNFDKTDDGISGHARSRGMESIDGERFQPDGFSEHRRKQFKGDGSSLSEQNRGIVKMPLRRYA